jgi:hypothetical protein
VVVLVGMRVMAATAAVVRSQYRQVKVVAELAVGLVGNSTTVTDTVAVSDF